MVRPEARESIYVSSMFDGRDTFGSRSKTAVLNHTGLFGLVSLKCANVTSWPKPPSIRTSPSSFMANAGLAWMRVTRCTASPVNAGTGWE